MIKLIGPGGAGKTTVGRALATRLGIAFVDLDQQFTTHAGVIRSRFRVYWGLPGKKFETSGPVDALADDLAAYLRPTAACSRRRLVKS